MDRREPVGRAGLAGGSGELIRVPAPLRPGNRIAVTAPSSGVGPALRPRLELAVAHLRDLGYDVQLGDCLLSDAVTSAPAARRAAELQAMLLDPAVRAVVPPWGGELAIDLLPRLDWDALRAAEPTWLIGYSDLSTLLLPLTLLAGWATVHSPNLMDTPSPVPPPLLSWLDVVTGPGPFVQGPSARHLAGPWADWAVDPAAELRYEAPTRWQVLGGGEVHARGRLVGGCLETLGPLAATPYADLPAAFAGEPLLVYLEVAEWGPAAVARQLWALRLAGWFDRASAVLLGRPAGPDDARFSQADAVAEALGDLPVPVVIGVDIGHVPPQLALVNGARAELSVTASGGRLVQELP